MRLEKAFGRIWGAKSCWDAVSQGEDRESSTEAPEGLDMCPELGRSNGLISDSCPGTLVGKRRKDPTALGLACIKMHVYFLWTDVATC